jgi:hypothetical protein
MRGKQKKRNVISNERLLPHRAHTPERSDREIKKKERKYTIFKAGARVGRPSTFNFFGRSSPDRGRQDEG